MTTYCDIIIKFEESKTVTITSAEVVTSGGISYASGHVNVTTGPMSGPYGVDLYISPNTFSITLPYTAFPNLGGIPDPIGDPLVGIDVYSKIWFPSASYGYGFRFASEFIYDPYVAYYSDGIYFNTTLLPNANINNIEESVGGKTWDISGFTDDYTKIQSIMILASDLKIGSSVSGLQYVISQRSSGTLIVKPDVGYGPYVFNTRCFIQAPVSVEKFNLTYFYSLKVVQSAYSELEI
jgi:hypothetical protein